MENIFKVEGIRYSKLKTGIGKGYMRNKNLRSKTNQKLKFTQTFNKKNHTAQKGHYFVEIDTFL